MDSTSVYLVRHGQTEWNVEQRMQGHLDSPLTREGQKQAAQLRDRLKEMKWDAIFSSSSPRAVQTAEIISGMNREHVRQLDAFKEINMGLWEGQLLTEIHGLYTREYGRFFEEPHLYCPTEGGETYFELLVRGVSALEDILTAFKGGKILIVTHRITLKVIMNYYFGNTLSEMREMPDIAPASLSSIHFKDGKSFIELYGDNSHYANHLAAAYPKEAEK
ncbi:histidine phosphatase family protein [Paenibacillus sp. UNC451MF]|uniref:histidine phosphatase family protein n=1 Tax=Paenibacillus sp. UNC451MF TaxID=1449063 RepID=UPI00056BA83E|nr:histidine phosphatase family protein [Paenibacillus sp. UNC451MF]